MAEGLRAQMCLTGAIVPVARRPLCGGRIGDSPGHDLEAAQGRQNDAFRNAALGRSDVARTGSMRWAPHARVPGAGELVAHTHRSTCTRPAASSSRPRSADHATNRASPGIRAAGAGRAQTASHAAVSSRSRSSRMASAGRPSSTCVTSSSATADLRLRDGVNGGNGRRSRGRGRSRIGTAARPTTWR